MADPVDPQNPAAAGETAPVAAAPAPVPPSEPVAPPPAQAAEVTPAPAPADPASAAPVAEPAAEPTPAEPPKEKSLFEEATLKPPGEEPKPAEATAEPPKDPVAEPPKDPTAPVEPEPLPAMDYTYTLPEGMTLNEEQSAALTAGIDQARRDGNIQPLIDLYHQGMGALVEQMRDAALDHQRSAWRETTQTWRNQAKADPDFGGINGNRFDTSMGLVAITRDTFMSDHARGTPEWEADARAMAEFLEYTGAGNHPTFLKFAARIARFVGEPPAEDLPTDTGAVPQKMPGANRNPLHDHPRSQVNGR